MSSSLLSSSFRKIYISSGSSILSALGRKNETCSRLHCRLFRTCVSASSTTTETGTNTPEKSGSHFSGYVPKEYYCEDKWDSRLQSALLQKVEPNDLFYKMDRRFAEDQVMSAIDVDLFVNKVSNEEDSLEEIEEVVHRLRTTPATVDTLPSTSHAVIRAFMKAGQSEQLIRILNDRMNYGVFLDYHSANLLMNDFLKASNYRDAAKIASFLMLQEDFGPATTQYFCLVSCIKYLEHRSPEPWNPFAPPKDESKEEVKIRSSIMRNPFHDFHFDLLEPDLIIGKTLALLGCEATLQDDNEILARSVEALGWSYFNKWEKVETLLTRCSDAKLSLAEESHSKIQELITAKLSEIEASPTKTLAKPQLTQYPGGNLDPKDVETSWARINLPDYGPILTRVKNLISKVPVTKEFGLLSKAEERLKKHLSTQVDKEIKELCKLYETWENMRNTELDRQLDRLKRHELLQTIQKKKQELQEKEEVIFFFENEEEWMMKLPEDEQKGYVLPTEYIPSNRTPHVRVSIKNKKPNYRKVPYRIVTPKK